MGEIWDLNSSHQEMRSIRSKIRSRGRKGRKAFTASSLKLQQQVKFPGSVLLDSTSLTALYYLLLKFMRLLAYSFFLMFSNSENALSIG
jgi:hypothetical protein